MHIFYSSPSQQRMMWCDLNNSLQRFPLLGEHFSVRVQFANFLSLKRFNFVFKFLMMRVVRARLRLWHHRWFHKTLAENDDIAIYTYFQGPGTLLFTPIWVYPSCWREKSWHYFFVTASDGRKTANFSSIKQ